MSAAAPNDPATGWTPPIVPRTPVGHEGDNVFELIAHCRSIARDLGWPQGWIADFTTRVIAAGSYEEACAVIRERFTLGDGD